MRQGISSSFFRVRKVVPSCGAPHFFIAHAKQTGKWGEDTKISCNLATAYFELFANSFGLVRFVLFER